MTVTTEADFERIAGIRCEEYREVLPNSGSSCMAHCSGGCQGSGYRFPWMWGECEAEHWSNPDDDYKSMGHSFRMDCAEDGCTGYVMVSENITDGLLRIVATLDKDNQCEVMEALWDGVITGKNPSEVLAKVIGSMV